MYVVTQNGDKLPVDDSKIDYDKGWHPFQQTVGLYDDSTILQPVWIAVFSKRVDHNGTWSYKGDKDHDPLEYIGSRIFEHEPSKEELLWCMSAYGCRRFDVVTIDKGYMLDVGDYDDN